jgi:hypothetical protein
MPSQKKLLLLLYAWQGVFLDTTGFIAPPAGLSSETGAPAGQMFSPVAYRGRIMQLTPQGQLLPYASGFRSPNGLGVDLQGHLFATDNQGDWVGTSSLYHVKKDRFATRLYL